MGKGGWVRAIWAGVAALVLFVGGLAPPASIARENGGKTARSAKAESAKPAVRSKRAVASASRGSAARKAVVARAGAKPSSVRVVARPSQLPGLSIGRAIGLREVDDPHALHSSVALVVDERSGATLLAKNAQAVLPIASITKLMTAMVVLDAELPLDEQLTIGTADIDTEKHTRSRLAPGTRLSRGELLQLALMSSENRAANALGRHYPGGLGAFVDAMNAKARSLGMGSTHFVEPTGLSSRNVSSAVDLSRMVSAALDYPLIRDYSTAGELNLAVGGRRPLAFRNTNRLVDDPDWRIDLQKTGYISEAGNCVVMHVDIGGRPMVVVLLDATGSRSRYGDAQRIRQWLETEGRIAPLRTTDASYPSFGS